MFDPVTAAVVGSAVIGGGSAVLQNRAAKKQQEGLNRATATQAQAQNRLIDLQERIFGEGAPFRALSLERAMQQQSLIPGILGRLQTPPQIPDLEAGVSESFGRTAERGLGILRATSAVTGSPFSGPAQIAQGEFLGGLGAREADRLSATRNQESLLGLQQGNLNLANLLSFAGAPPPPLTGLTQGTALSPAIAGISGNISDLQTSQGAVGAGLANAQAQTLAQVPALFNLFGGLGGAGATTSGLGAGGVSGGINLPPGLF